MEIEVTSTEYYSRIITFKVNPEQFKGKTMEETIALIKSNDLDLFEGSQRIESELEPRELGLDDDDYCIDLYDNEGKHLHEEIIQL